MVFILFFWLVGPTTTGSAALIMLFMPDTDRTELPVEMSWNRPKFCPFVTPKLLSNIIAMPDLL